MDESCQGSFESSSSKYLYTFRTDAARRAGVPLVGAHAEARCLRCHNDRGPVATFRAQGCVGCHADVHYGELGSDCQKCHDGSATSTAKTAQGDNWKNQPNVLACGSCHDGKSAHGLDDCGTCHQAK